MLPRFPTTSATWATGGVSRGFSWGSGRPWKHCSAKPMSYHKLEEVWHKNHKTMMKQLDDNMMKRYNKHRHRSVKTKCEEFWSKLMKTGEWWWLLHVSWCFFFPCRGSWRTFHWWNLAPFHSISELSQHMDLIITYDNYSAIVITKLTIITI